MNMFDEAMAIKTMLEIRGVTRKELSHSLGISVSAIANKLRLLNLDDETKAAITASELSERHARLLLRLDDKESRLKLIGEIADRGLTVAETEACLELKYLNVAKTAKDLKKQKIPCPEEAKEIFVENIKRSIESLTALGVQAKLSESIYGEKNYITIIIGDRS